VLSGLRVLDLTFYLPGPYATLILADLGAEVIKIENPAGGDPLRGLGPDGGSPAGSVFFQALNRGKKSVTLDLKTAEGRDAFLRLATTADGLVEQYRPGVTERLGIGSEAVRAVNPRLAYVSLTGYGQTGPHAAEAGHDLNYMARSGLLSLFAEDPESATAPFPLPPIQFADYTGGNLTATALLAAMLSARLTGEGRHVDVAMTDGIVALLSLTASNYLAGGGPPPERPNLFLAGGEPFYNLYRTADGRHLAVGALEPKFWANLCRVLAESDLEKKGPGVIASSREEAARIFATRTAAEWVERLAGLDVCVAPVLTVAEALAGEHVAARGLVIEAGGVRQIGPALTVVPESETRRRAGVPGSATARHRPAPRLGEHNRETLLALGYVEADIEVLAARGVISE
jgi:alpha-methylacyl-CoA racemase